MSSAPPPDDSAKFSAGFISNATPLKSYDSITPSWPNQKNIEQEHRLLLNVPSDDGLESFDSSKDAAAAGDDTAEFGSATLSSMNSNEVEKDSERKIGFVRVPSIRTSALELSLYVNLFITAVKFVAYLQTMSLSVLAALLDSLLDVVSQVVLNYTEKRSTITRSSALYPAGAARLEPIGVLTCAALMGMASFEVLKESATALIFRENPFEESADGSEPSMSSVWSMLAIVFVKMLLWALCRKAIELNDHRCDPTMEALAQDHYNDCLSNGVAAVALLLALKLHFLWFLDPVGAVIISFYIIYSWYHTGKEQIEQLTGKVAPKEFVDELLTVANSFIDDRIMSIDVCRVYHFGPKFLVELEIILPRDTVLTESHDLGMELQYEIEGREEVERCFVHIDYEARPYDEHVVSKVPELREKYRPGNKLLRYRSAASV